MVGALELAQLVDSLPSMGFSVVYSSPQGGGSMTMVTSSGIGPLGRRKKSGRLAS